MLECLPSKFGCASGIPGALRGVPGPRRAREIRQIVRIWQAPAGSGRIEGSWEAPGASWRRSASRGFRPWSAPRANSGACLHSGDCKPACFPSFVCQVRYTHAVRESNGLSRTEDKKTLKNERRIGERREKLTDAAGSTNVNNSLKTKYITTKRTSYPHPAHSTQTPCRGTATPGNALPCRDLRRRSPKPPGPPEDKKAGPPEAAPGGKGEWRVANPLAAPGGDRV